MHRFFQVQLRTTDLVAARAFYASVLGEALATELPMWTLHENAIARGARPHWLGSIDVDDLDTGSSAFVTAGATPLGPRGQDASGNDMANFRDPGGAVVSLAKLKNKADPRTRDTHVAWHVLNTPNVAQAKMLYASLCGWEPKAPIDLGTLGILHPFAWEPGGAIVGMMIDLAGRPGVHPHWLFHFDVPSLDRAVDAARAAGGLALEPITLPSGERIAVFDDPQGAAFACREQRASR